MALTLENLENEKTLLRREFDKLNEQIKKVEFDLGGMRSNLNAIHGAIQQTDKFIEVAKSETPEESK